MRFAAAIFDLDGTLIDSLADIGTAMNQALCSQHPDAAFCPGAK